MEFRRASLALCVALTFVLLVPGASFGNHGGEGIAMGVEGVSDAAPAEGGSWTLALYVAADNDLEMYWERPSLEYLLRIPESEGLNIVAIVDYLTVDGVERIEISGGSYEVVETYPEMNFGDGATFSWFLTEVNTYYPADHLIVIPWNHGSAWRGFCWDETSNHDRITLEEMEEAIVDAGVYIDILAFDACACSSIEMVYQAARTGLVGLLVSSEELVAGDGFPYDTMFTPVALDPSRTPLQVAEDMVAGWRASYEPLPWSWYCSLGIVDIMEIAESSHVIDEWVLEMTRGLPDYTWNYRKALRDSYSVSCGSHFQVDMVDLGRQMLNDPLLAQDTALVDATMAMMDLIESAVKGVYNTDRTSACGGVSIYWGVHNIGWRGGYEMYSGLTFATDSGWGDFLIQYNQLTCGWMRNLA